MGSEVPANADFNKSDIIIAEADPDLEARLLKIKTLGKVLIISYCIAYFE